MLRGVLLAAALAWSAALSPGMVTPAQVTAACPADLAAPGLRCATVQVPENRTTGKGRAISLRIAVLPARGRDRAPDPLFVLAGGPGAAATTYIGGYADDPIRDRRDIVFMDQRGTGGSNPLMCRFYLPDDAARGVFADFMPIDRVRACRAELEAGADLSLYTTEATVGDLEDVRRALGYERINLGGSSYGTRLAMEYVRAHGGRVRSVMLDGVVPPALRMPAGFGRTAQQALDGVLAECEATPDCAAAFPAIRQRAGEVFERLARAPAVIPASGSAPAMSMTRDNVAEALRYLTYSTSGASRVPLLLHRAHAGDFSGLAGFLTEYRGDGRFEALYLSVSCAEDVPFLPADASARDRGTYLGDYRIGQQREACAAWPRGTARASTAVVRSGVPALLITGMLDPVTAPAFNDLVAAGLPNSLNLKVPSAGHSLWGITNIECVRRIKLAFIERGSVRGIDTACVARMRRAGFALR